MEPIAMEAVQSRDSLILIRNETIGVDGLIKRVYGLQKWFGIVLFPWRSQVSSGAEEALQHSVGK